MNHPKGQIYVAELRMPSCFRPSSEEREVIPNPHGFDVTRGYWKVRPSDENSTVEGPPQISLVIEFVSATLRDAEDHALKVASMFSSIASAYGGYPLGPPSLRRIASVGASGDLVAQHDYNYLSRPSMLSLFDQTVKHRFQGYLQAISALDDNTKHRLQSAIHWYGMSISADDPTVSYVAAWTGLECIGPAINSLCHPNGPKAPCGVCKNEVGEGRDKKLAGIDHMVRRLQSDPPIWSLHPEAKETLTGELVDGFSREEAARLRNSVVHGENIQGLMQKCSDYGRHLIYVLLASIQIALHRASDSPVGSWLPGDYGFRPDARSSLKFNEGLRKSPYLDEWIEGLSWQSQPGTSPDEVTVVSTQRKLDESTSSFVELESLEIFKRNVDVYSYGAQSMLTGLSAWDGRPREPRWRQPGD